ncbi:MAG: aspartate--tRNA(Asn) ligase [Thermoplasmata archaeon]
MNVEFGWRSLIHLSEIDESEYGRSVKVGGWIEDIRNLGGIAFVQLRDRDGIVQVTAVKKEDIEIFRTLTTLPRESVIVVEGRIQENKEVKLGFEILPIKVEVLSRAETPLPLGVVDKVRAELDTRLDNRFLDLRKPRESAMFKVRSVLIEGMREHLRKERFLEIHTPKIVAAGAEGGATLFPIQYFGTDAYLAQSPQLYKQILMAAGFDRVFEIAPAYRAEKSDTTRHIAEFISLDVEIAFIGSSEDVMDCAQELVREAIVYVSKRAEVELELLGIELEVPDVPFKRISFRECAEILKEKGKGLTSEGDMDSLGERLIGRFMKEKHGVDFYFITDFPTAIKGSTFYAMRKSEDPSLTGYFDLGYSGLELVSGGQREHRYDELIEQMKENDLDLSSFEFYLKAFRYGMPPHGGFGLGIERFLQRMLNLSNIRECVLFPRDRSRLVP